MLKFLTPTAEIMALPALHPRTHILWVKTVASAAFLASVSPGFAAEGPSVGTLPYANNSTVENQLDFATSGTQLAPLPTGLNLTSATAASTTAGSWTLTSSGSTRLDYLNATTLRASTATTGPSNNALQFYVTTTGLSDIASISLSTLSWTASYTIPSSDGISLVAGQQYRYEFDLALSDSLFSLSSSVLGGLTLSIGTSGAGSSNLYSASSGTGFLQDILGLSVSGYFTSQSSSNSGVNFTYTGSSPITITFSGTQTLSSSILAAFTGSLYTISNTDIIAIPEAETCVLAAVGGLVFMTTLRRRFRSL